MVEAAEAVEAAEEAVAEADQPPPMLLLAPSLLHRHQLPQDLTCYVGHVDYRDTDQMSVPREQSILPT